MKKSVAALSGLLGLEADVVEASITEDTLDGRITDFKDNYRVQKKEDFEKYEANIKKEAREDYYKELLESAKSGDLNGDLYKTIKGAALQMAEKDLAKKYGIEQYKNLSDVVEQIKSKSGGTDDEQVQKLLENVEDLKKANVKLKDERDQAVSDERQKYKARFLDGTLDGAIKNLPFDFDGLGDEDKQAAQKSTPEIVRSVFVNRYNLDTDDDYTNVFVSDKDGNVVKAEATREAVPVQEVLSKLTKELNIKMKSPEKGGQGGSSSQSTTTSEYKTYADIKKAIAEKKVDPYDPEVQKQIAKLVKES